MWLECAGTKKKQFNTNTSAVRQLQWRDLPLPQCSHLQTQFHHLSCSVQFSILGEASATGNMKISRINTSPTTIIMLNIKTKQQKQNNTILKVTNLKNQSTTYGTRKWTKNIFNCNYKSTDFSSGQHPLHISLLAE